MRLLAITVLTATLTTAIGVPTAANAQADFYRGKQINIVIGAFPGGGYDVYARLLARYLGRHLTGNPTILAQNMPGAASAKAAAYLYSQAPNDGTTIGAIFPGTVVDPLLGEKQKTGFDPSRFIYLGSATEDVFLCIVRADAPVKEFPEVFTKEVILGATGEGGSNKTFPAMLDNILGAKFRLVSGYPGTRETTLAMEKGEVQGLCGMSWSSISAEHPDWVSSGKVRILVQEHAKGHPEVNKMDVPRSIDFAKSPQDRQIMELVYDQEIFGRPYVLPPGVPMERVTMLRKAFSDTLADKDLVAETRKLNLDLSPTSGGELQDLVTMIYATPAPVIQRARESLVYKPPR